MAISVADGSSAAYWRARAQKAEEALWGQKGRPYSPPPVDMGEARIVGPLALDAPSEEDQ